MSISGFEIKEQNTFASAPVASTGWYWRDEDEKDKIIASLEKQLREARREIMDLKRRNHKRR